MRDPTSPYIKLTLARSRRRSFVYRASSDALDWWQDATVDTDAGDVPCTLAADADGADNLAGELRLSQLHVIISDEN